MLIYQIWGFHLFWKKNWFSNPTIQQSEKQKTANKSKCQKPQHNTNTPAPEHGQAPDGRRSSQPASDRNRINERTCSSELVGREVSRCDYQQD